MPTEPTADQLRELLGTLVYDYYAGGAEDETTLRANQAAWRNLPLTPQIPSATDHPDDNSPIELLPGTTASAPLLLAPCALAKLAHPGGESAVARAVASHTIPMVISTTASETIEETAAAAPDSTLWFQLYAVPDRAITADLIARAESAGCKALVLTADTPTLGRRERDTRNQFALPPGIRIANLERYGNSAYSASRKDPTLTWDVMQWLRTQTALPVVVKGILNPDDAQLAVRYGADALIVSNHGGRQLNGAPATADLLPSIRDTVGRQIRVFVDGGIRSGSDIVRARLLGADAALVGRPWLWALAHGGEAGVRTWLEALLTEYRQTETMRPTLFRPPSR